MTEHRQPPHSIFAEQSLLGGLMLDSAAYEQIADLVAEQSFYRDDHRRIYRHIVKLIDGRKQVDVLTVFDSLHSSGEDERAGGLAYLGEIANNTPSAANIIRYAEIIRDKALLRALVESAGKMESLAYEASDKSAMDRLSTSAEMINKVLQTNVRSGSMVTFQQATQQTVIRLQDCYDGEIVKPSTGLADLDKKLASLGDGDMIVIGGRPGMGKTSIAQQIMEHLCSQGRPGVGYIASMEMPAEQLTRRSMARRGRISLAKLMEPKSLQDQDFIQITNACVPDSMPNIIIDDEAAQTTGMIRVKLNKLRREHGKIIAVMIDYIQLMRSTTGENRTQQLSEITREIKALAKEFECPILALSQLNRSLEQRPNKRPIMSDLRESGSIEQDADTILFVYRDDIYNPDSEDKGYAEVIFGKQRNGEAGGTAMLSFQGEYSMFGDVDWPSYNERHQEREQEAPRGARGRGLR